ASTLAAIVLALSPRMPCCATIVVGLYCNNDGAAASSAASPARAEQPLPLHSLQTRRRRRLQEVEQHLHEAPRLVAMGKVSGGGEDREPTAGNHLVRHTAVGNRDHRVLLAPDEQHGHLGR